VQDLLVFSRPRPLRLDPIELRLLLLDAITALRRNPAAEYVQAEDRGRGRGDHR
jgi:hypothetical protein